MKKLFFLIFVGLAFSGCVKGGDSTDGPGGNAELKIPVTVNKTEFGQVCSDRRYKEPICPMTRPLVTGSLCTCYNNFGQPYATGVVTR